MGKMVVEVDQDGGIVLKNVYSGVKLQTEEGNAIGVCMRDDTLEINVLPWEDRKPGGNWWRVDMQKGAIEPMRKLGDEFPPDTCSHGMVGDGSCPTCSIRERKKATDEPNSAVAEPVRGLVNALSGAHISHTAVCPRCEKRVLSAGAHSCCATPNQTIRELRAELLAVTQEAKANATHNRTEMFSEIKELQDEIVALKQRLLDADAYNGKLEAVEFAKRHLEKRVRQLSVTRDLHNAEICKWRRRNQEQADLVGRLKTEVESRDVVLDAIWNRLHVAGFTGELGGFDACLQQLQRLLNDTHCDCGKELCRGVCVICDNDE